MGKAVDKSKYDYALERAPLEGTGVMGHRDCYQTTNIPVVTFGRVRSVLVDMSNLGLFNDCAFEALPERIAELRAAGWDGWCGYDCDMYSSYGSEEYPKATIRFWRRATPEEAAAYTVWEDARAAEVKARQEAHDRAELERLQRKLGAT